MNIEKKILLSTALFIGTMFGVNAQEICPLTQVNREIVKTRHSIDSVRTAHSKDITYRLQHNDNYRYIQDNAACVDTLPRENERLLTMAAGIIRRKYPGALLVRTPVLFIEYRNVPGIGTIGDMYRRNSQKMLEYNRRVAAFQPEYLLIKNRCDSIMHAKIEMYQMRMDSLLNRKRELIR